MTSLRHSIRLHGPWESALLNSASGLVIDDAFDSVVVFGPRAANEGIPQSTRVQIPDQWPLLWKRNKFEAVRLERRFGLPTGLDPEQNVWLVVEAEYLAVSCYLNQRWLGSLAFSETRFEFSIRPYLHSRNCLRLDIQAACQNPESESLAINGSIREIRLEIR